MFKIFLISLLSVFLLFSCSKKNDEKNIKSFEDLIKLTAAKKEIHLYTSMHPNDVRLQEGAAQGKIILKSYIEYAKTGKLEIGDTSEGKEPMSEFEVFVKKK